MRAVKRSLLEDAAAMADGSGRILANHIEADSPRRQEAESFIRKIFFHHHGARVHAFAPNLVLIEENGAAIAAAGWRGADHEPLFLERYLDESVETLMERLTGQPFVRSRLAEVGHLASERPGGSLPVILTLAGLLHGAGYEWVVFTATRRLIGIFTKLGLPLLALAKADPARLGEEAKDWGNYYDEQPVVVAGRIRLALEKIGAGA